MKPERFWVEVPQMMFPEESVVRELEPEQDWTVAIFKPPAEMLSPCRVFVALAFVWRILPPVMVNPEEVAVRPEAWRPLYIVEVAPATKLPTPWIERMLPGVVVPMPTLPPVLIANFVPDRVRDVP